MNPLLQLREHGQSYWLDNLSREKIDSGELRRRVRDEGMRGITSNPAIFAKAMQHGSDYDEQIKAAVVDGGESVSEIYDELTTTDVRDACDDLRPVYDESGGADGFVSLEVSPWLAHDTEGTIEAVRRLAAMVDRPNCLIKIPGLPAGIPAIEQCLYEGYSINITLLFGIEAYEAVAEAYMQALERRLAEGLPIDGIHSVASFFLSRIDVLCDQRLAQRQNGHTPDERQMIADTRGRVAVANAKLAYRSFRKMLDSDRWQALEKAGANIQRMLWASTSTKNPAYRDVMYVEPLIGPHTINTLPDATIEAFGDHGEVADTVEEGLDEAGQVMRDLEHLGIGFAGIVQQLQGEGVDKFIQPYEQSMRVLEEKVHRFHNREVAAALADVAQKLRCTIIRMTTKAGSGHATSSLSAADLAAALYFDKMRWDPSAPKARNVDQFVFSKGHASPLLWAALAEAGAIDEDPMTLRRIDSTLEGHPTPRNPWVRVATGSLGQGLADANGMALANRLDSIDARIYCLLGDGECSEGSVWEAAQFASLAGLANVVAIVDVNALGQSDPAPYRHDTTVHADRFRAFGWKAIEIDGHDMSAILDALDEAAASEVPVAIVARTIKGKGVSFLEGARGWHGKALDSEQAEQALHEIGDPQTEITIRPRRVGADAPIDAPESAANIAFSYERGEEVPTRNAFGSALVRLGEQIPELVVLDGDVKNSTRTEYFARSFPERFFEGFIAEQNMAGTGLGLARSGKLPVVASFACFLTRASDFIRMAGHSAPAHMIFCGSHAGVSIGEDGPSQMGLEDIAMFRAMGHSTILYPCDAVSAERLTEAATRTPGIVYLRTTRGATPVIYPGDEDFPVGGSKLLRSSVQDVATVVAAGITVHEAMAAGETLADEGIPVRLIDAYSLRPLDGDTLRTAAAETGFVLTVEDHWAEGGLGDAVAAEVAGIAPVRKLAVRGEPRSGKPEELLERHGISRDAIIRELRARAREHR